MGKLWPQGWFRASLSLQTRAATALQAYRRAEARFHECQKWKDALDAEERVLLHIWSMKLSKTHVGPKDYEAFQSAYLSLSERRAELSKPWQAANADLALACKRVESVLKDVGFRSALNA